MRILFVSHYALPHMGGIEVVVDALARELAGRGHQVTHLASSAGAGGMAGAPYRVVRVAAANGLERSLGVPYPLFGPRLAAELRRELARADVVHAHGFLYQGTLAAFALAGRDRGPARVLTEHVGHVPYSSRALDRAEAAAIATLGRWSARAAGCAIVFNERVRELLARLAPSTRLEWVDNGIDTELFRPPEAGERDRTRAELGWNGEPRVLFVGRPVDKKGFDLALSAVRAAERPVRLAVAGVDDAGGVPEDVEVLGRLPRERLALVYRAADALLVTARGEGLPLTVAEALASGLPVIANDDFGYRRVLGAAGDPVSLVAPDPGPLGSAISARLRAPGSPPDARAVEFARSTFSLARSADRHERLYRELVERAGR